MIGHHLNADIVMNARREHLIAQAQAAALAREARASRAKSRRRQRSKPATSTRPVAAQDAAHALTC